VPRLLIVGKKIARLNCVDWSEWQAHNLLDYPGLLLDCRNLSSQLAVDESKRQELQRWSEMLWLTGVRLQTRVSEALAFLGVQNESKNPTGHVEDLEGTCLGRPVIFEVTASAGSIGVEKARQLLQWIGESADPTNTKGVLIGNAYRNEPPEKRPPTPDHKIFVKEAEDMAQKFHFGLLDVQDLFELVLRKLSGEDIRAEWICERLQTDGVIKFGNQ
jgi:hypothetical protein